MDDGTKISKNRIRERERDIEVFIASISDFLKKNSRKILKRVISGDATVQETLAILGSLETELEALGLTQELKALEFLHADEMKAVRDAMARVSKNFTLSELDRDVIIAMAEFDTRQVGTYVNQYVGSLRSSMMSSIFLGETPDFESLVDNGDGLLAHRARTELRTALAALNRTATLKKADDLNIEYFEYVGPDDDKTREFCAERVGEVFTRSEIASWDNGQGLPADVYLGGYNCRHQLVAIPSEEGRRRRGEEEPEREFDKAA